MIKVYSVYTRFVGCVFFILFLVNFVCEIHSFKEGSSFHLCFINVWHSIL